MKKNRCRQNRTTTQHIMTDIGNFFSNLFGGWGQQTPAPTPEPEPTPVVTPPETAILTLEKLKVITPHGKDAILQGLAEGLTKYFPQYQITTPLRQAHFLGQAAH